MRNLLRTDGALYRGACLAAFLLTAGTTWLVASLPLVTAPPATAGLYAACRLRVESRTNPRVRDCLAETRRLTPVSYRLAVVVAPLSAAVALDLWYAKSHDHAVLTGAATVLALVVGYVFAQVWPALVRTGSVRDAFALSLRICVTRPDLAVCAAAVWAVALPAAAFAPAPVAAATLMCAPSAVAYAGAWASTTHHRTSEVTP